MKKNLFVIVILAAVLFGTAGCGRDRHPAIDPDRITVTTTIFPPFDFVRNIAGDRVNLFMLLPPGSESHSFEPSPRDIITIMNSDVFIHVGGAGDEWVRRILESMDTDGMTVLAMMDMVELLKEEIVEGMEDFHGHHHHGHHHHDHRHGFWHNILHAISHILPFVAHPHHHDHHAHHHHHDDEAEFDEHVWTSPRNAIMIVRAIAEALSEADPANAYYFRQNAEAYIAELEEIDALFTEIVSTAQRRTIVFGDRFPFRYFTHAYGLEYFAAFHGCSTETEPSAATVAFLINKIRNEQIPVVFHIELSTERMADTISGETGARKLMLHSLHNVTRRDFDAGLGYLYFMRRNAENLRIALN